MTNAQWLALNPSSGCTERTIVGDIVQRFAFIHCCTLVFQQMLIPFVEYAVEGPQEFSVFAVSNGLSFVVFMFLLPSPGEEILEDSVRAATTFWFFFSTRLLSGIASTVTRFAINILSIVLVIPVSTTMILNDECGANLTFYVTLTCILTSLYSIYKLVRPKDPPQCSE